MTALALKRPQAGRGKSIHSVLTRFANAIDRIISARAARAVSEWQMREIDAEIRRYTRLAKEAASRR